MKNCCDCMPGPYDPLGDVLSHTLESGRERRTAQTWAATAKSWAVGDTGIRAGEDTDNAKYYAGQAAGSAAAAEKTAGAAAGSADAAAGAAKSAADSAGDAKASADAAAASQTAAKASETNAQNSANTAKDAAGKAVEIAGFDPENYYKRTSIFTGLAKSVDGNLERAVPGTDYLASCTLGTGGIDVTTNRRYCTFAKFPNTTTAENVSATMLFENAINYGTNGARGLWAIQIWARRANYGAYINELIPVPNHTVIFGFWNDEQFRYFGAYVSPFTMKSRVTELGKTVGSITVGDIYQTTETPEGWTEVPISGIEEIKTVTLTNTAAYPENKSRQSVSLTTVRANANYTVDAHITSVTLPNAERTVLAKGDTAGVAGNIIISDKATNGFKVEYTGTARAVTVELTVRGGM